MTTTRIPHDGSACPVSPGTRVRVWFRDGDVDADFARQFSSDDPDMNLWLHGADPQEGAEIIAYVIIEPDWAVEGPKLVRELAMIADESGDPDNISKRELAARINEIACAALRRVRGE